MFFTYLVKWGKLGKYSPGTYLLTVRRGDRRQVCPSSQDTSETTMKLMGEKRMETTWMKAFEVFQKKSNIN